MKLPDFSFEEELWGKGIANVAGVDEVGRGAFAGPVVTACVVYNNLRVVLPFASPKSTHKGTPALGFPGSRHPLVLIDDSKRLSPRQREVSAVWIKENSKAWGIGVSGVSEINKLGIVGATNRAFRRAINKVTSNGLKIDHVLTDAFLIPHIPGLSVSANQTAIIKGDQKSFSIASASIVAKVERDRIMSELSAKNKFSVYFWQSNKGYGTGSHREAIAKNGTTKLHRKTFVVTWLRKQQEV